MHIKTKTSKFLKNILITTLLGSLMMTASAQNPWQTLATEVKADHPLVKQFQGCVSAVGLNTDLPLLEKTPSISMTGTFLRLNDTGRIRDGYVHTLYVAPDKTMYIIQVGGIAGTQKFFGPLDAAMKCPANPEQK
ncbi:MAG: hypothetical protein E6Q34_01070 [Burkholderiaceae bacterium]|nr:MAG: hypothetical protein E6Q34_01070 [Burkholderiaceae bacterium]